MRRFLQFTLTSDARKQIPRMILERLADEFLWQGHEFSRGPVSIKNRARRIQQEIEREVIRRNAQREFEGLLSVRTRLEKEKTG